MRSLPSTTSPGPKPVAEPWVSIDDVAAHLGVRKDSIYRWIEKRGLPATKIGKLWKLKLSEVDTWARGEGAVSRAAAEDAKTARNSTFGNVILIVDDDMLVRASVADFLEDNGYRVLLAADGEQALQLLASASPRPNLVLLDLKMPNVDGWQFREEQLRDANIAAVPVVVVTAATVANLDGVSAVLRKPVRLPLLARTIETLLEEDKAERI